MVNKQALQNILEVTVNLDEERQKQLLYQENSRTSFEMIRNVTYGGMSTKINRDVSYEKLIKFSTDPVKFHSTHRKRSPIQPIKVNYESVRPRIDSKRSNESPQPVTDKAKKMLAKLLVKQQKQKEIEKAEKSKLEH
jgi:hypothetical protein